jgi:methionyl aminopeptidase
MTYEVHPDPELEFEDDEEEEERPIVLKTREEIELMRESAQIVSRTLGIVAEAIEPGVTPLELDKLAEDYIRSQGAEPGFLGLYDFPNSLCISVNDAIIHGVPTDKPLKEGDIISVDCGALKNGFYGDHAFTFAVGQIESKVEKLLRVTRKCLDLGVKEAVAGNTIGHIANAIQTHAENYGYGVVREFVGHGLGREMHEAPQIPNYGRKGELEEIVDGMVLAIEPMINMGVKEMISKDHWTVVTADGKPSAHFEHNVAIINGKPDILSTFDYVDEALRKKGR